MISLYNEGAYLYHGSELIPREKARQRFSDHDSFPEPNEARKGTIAWSVLQAHNHSGKSDRLQIKFDAMASHDITFVGIIQTAKASGMTHFPLPYVLTNCHNSLCAVGGTINEDDHVFGLSAAKKYGGIYVPPHMAVIHQYMRETMAGCGKMILGSDSHTRYGALGTMAVGEGGGELVKQLLNNTWDISCPEVVGVYLKGKPQPGVGPQDIALAIIGAVFKNGFVKNKVMEFVGPGIAELPTDYRNGIDVMTTETTCLTSIWQTDEDTRAWLALHHREGDYKKLAPADITWYDAVIEVDLSAIKPMIALPFHPSHTWSIDELNDNLEDILQQVEKEARVITEGKDISFSLTDKIQKDKLMIRQGIIAGCAGGTWSNIMAAAQILKNHPVDNDDFTLSIYPSSQPVFLDLVKNGAVAELMQNGAVIKTAFCGPCFGAGDTPSNNSLSIRHTTRNFPNREGSKPGMGQLSAVALMDARSIAATAANGGVLTSALGKMDEEPKTAYCYDDSPYHSRVACYYGKAESRHELVYAPNIKDWPEMHPLADHILLKVCSKIMDDVTTTDELIPSGETSSYRSNPLGLAEFTLSRRDPEYVGRSKKVDILEKARCNDEDPAHFDPELVEIYHLAETILPDVPAEKIEIGSMIYCVKPGDGSAREQAASCQRVIGGLANICQEYATKRYRSNVMNWGMLPFQLNGDPNFEVGDWILIPNVIKALDAPEHIPAYVLKKDIKILDLYLAPMTETEKAIVKAGCLINYNKENKHD